MLFCKVRYCCQPYKAKPLGTSFTDWPVLLRRLGSWHSRRNTALKNCVGEFLFPDEVHHSSRVLPFLIPHSSFMEAIDTLFSASAVAHYPPHCVTKPLFSHSFHRTKPSLATSYELRSPLK